MPFPPFGNSDHVVVSVSIDFPSYSQWGASFHCIGYDYSGANWDGLCDHWRDVPREDIFKLSASVVLLDFAGGFRLELMYISLSKVSGQASLISMTWRFCLLHLKRQNCVLKTFLRTLILMTLVSLYLFSLLELI